MKALYEVVWRGRWGDELGRRVAQAYNVFGDPVESSEVAEAMAEILLEHAPGSVVIVSEIKGVREEDHG